jgi:putative spermidine/putrescine transport system ATP-binding protein
MSKGKVEQFDTPVAIYDQPQTLFVNGFIGTSNLLPGKLTALAGGTATVELDAGATLHLPAPDGMAAGTPVLLSVRPEQLALSPVATAGSWPIHPGLSLPLGPQIVHEARTTDGVMLKIVEPRLRGTAAATRGFCALAPDARPSLFLRSTLPATE